MADGMTAAQRKEARWKAQEYDRQQAHERAEREAMRDALRKDAVKDVRVET